MAFLLLFFCIAVWQTNRQRKWSQATPPQIKTPNQTTLIHGDNGDDFIYRLSLLSLSLLTHYTSCSIIKHNLRIIDLHNVQYPQNRIYLLPPTSDIYYYYKVYCIVYHKTSPTSLKMPLPYKNEGSKENYIDIAILVTANISA